MKVVLFCGGMGTRIRDYSESIPKPLVPIGYRPILWHIMKYYAHYGHRDFILCLGYKADAIKSYFLNYNECLSNDFVFSDGGRNVKLTNSDIQDWNITFVDTGLNSNIGQRLKLIEPYLDNDERFLANYSDGLTDLYLPDLIKFADQNDRVATFLSVQPNQSFHRVDLGTDGIVEGISDMKQANIWVNGGYFVFKREIFDYINYGEELVNEPFARLIARRQLVAQQHRSFWACMDTFKEKQQLDDLYSRQEAPWEVWRPKTRLPAAFSTLSGTAPVPQTTHTAQQHPILAA